MSESVSERIARHEGFRSHVYQDAKGFLSIGYGTTVGRVGFMPGDSPRALMFRDEGVGITQSQARGMVWERVTIIRGQLSNESGWWDHSKIRRDVLVEMAYQLGVKGCLNFQLMWAALDVSKYETAAAEMLDSRWAKQTPERAEELAGIMHAGTAEEPYG